MIWLNTLSSCFERNRTSHINMHINIYTPPPPPCIYEVSPLYPPQASTTCIRAHLLQAVFLPLLAQEAAACLGAGGQVFRVPFTSLPRKVSRWRERRRVPVSGSERGEGGPPGWRQLLRVRDSPASGGGKRHGHSRQHWVTHLAALRRGFGEVGVSFCLVIWAAAGCYALLFLPPPRKGNCCSPVPQRWP